MGTLSTWSGCRNSITSPALRMASQPAGTTRQWQGSAANSLSAAERQTHLCHPMTCPYVVRTLSAADRLLAADPCHCLVVPAGCDAMRRAGDVMEFRHPDQVLNVPIPRELDRNAASALAAHLDHLHGWLAHRRTQSTMTPAQASSSSSPGPGPASISHPALEQPHGVFVVAGRWERTVCSASSVTWAHHSLDSNPVLAQREWRSWRTAQAIGRTPSRSPTTFSATASAPAPPPPPDVNVCADDWSSLNPEPYCICANLSATPVPMTLSLHRVWPPSATSPSWSWR